METIRQLLAELAAIEANLHNYADPQLAMAGKQRELLEKMVLVMQRHDDTLQDLGARVECLEAVRRGQDSYDQKTDALVERIESLEQRAAPGVGYHDETTAEKP